MKSAARSAPRLTDKQVVLLASTIIDTILRRAMNHDGARVAPETPPAVAEGIYVGLTIADGKPAKLYLLPGEAESINWKDAGEWAKKQGGELPSRFDALVLFENLKKEFKEAYYWTAAQRADVPACAWCQYFYWGRQSLWHQDAKIRARAVRRLPI